MTWRHAFCAEFGQHWDAVKKTNETPKIWGTNFDVALEYADLSLPLRFLRVGDPRSSPARLEADLEPRDKAALQCP